MSIIEIRQPDLSELAKVQQLRHVVLDPVRLIEIDHELTPDDFLEETIHMAAFESENVVATVRLDLVEPETYEVRKMAVDLVTRSRGIGRFVLEAALDEAHSCGASGFTLDSRREAIPFSKNLALV